MEPEQCLRHASFNGACSLGHSCASLFKPHTLSLSMTISPNVISLFQHVHSVFLFLFFFYLSPCTVTSWSHWQHHSPCGSTIVTVNCCPFYCKTARSYSFLSSLSFSSSLSGMREHPPIPVIELADHIERLKANDGLRFSQEYEVRATYHCGASNSCTLKNINGFLCYCVREDLFLFDLVCMYSNGLWKTFYILQSFLQLHYQPY